MRKAKFKVAVEAVWKVKEKVIVKEKVKADSKAR